MASISGDLLILIFLEILHVFLKLSQYRVTGPSYVFKKNSIYYYYYYYYIEKLHAFFSLFFWSQYWVTCPF